MNFWAVEMKIKVNHPEGRGPVRLRINKSLCYLVWRGRFIYEEEAERPWNYWMLPLEEEMPKQGLSPGARCVCAHIGILALQEHSSTVQF